MSYSLEIEGLVAHKHKLEAEIEMLRAIVRRLVDESQEFGSPMNRTMTEARALLGDMQEPLPERMTEADLIRGLEDLGLGVVDPVQTPRRKVVGRVTGLIHEGDQVPGMPHAICHACGLKDYPCTNPDCPNVQSPPDRFEQAVRRMNELTEGMEVDPDDEIADEPHEDGGPNPQAGSKEG